MDPTQDIPTQSQAEDQTLRTGDHHCRCETTRLATDDLFESNMDPREARAQIIISKFSADASSSVGLPNPPSGTGAEQEEAAEVHPTVSEPWPYNPEEVWVARVRDAFS